MFYTAEIAIVNGEETASLFKWETMDDARKRLPQEHTLRNLGMLIRYMRKPGKTTVHSVRGVGH